MSQRECDIILSDDLESQCHMVECSLWRTLSIDYSTHLHGQATGNLHISKRKRSLEVLCDIICFPFVFPATLWRKIVQVFALCMANGNDRPKKKDNKYKWKQSKYTRKLSQEKSKMLTKEQKLLPQVPMRILLSFKISSRCTIFCALLSWTKMYDLYNIECLDTLIHLLLIFSASQVITSWFTLKI